MDKNPESAVRGPSRRVFLSAAAVSAAVPILAQAASARAVGFDSDDNQALLIDAAGAAAPTAKMSKRELSREIWDAIEKAHARRR